MGMKKAGKIDWATAGSGKAPMTTEAREKAVMETRKPMATKMKNASTEARRASSQ